MTHQQRFFLLFFLISCGSLSGVFAQNLSFADILKLYSLDSSAARQFCTGKQFNLMTAGNTGSNKRYRFATPDSATRLEITYPNDSASLNVQLNYWFGSAKEYSRLKKALGKNGFKLQLTKQVAGSLPSYAERYVAKNLQAELIRPEGKQSYWLFLHPVGNYSW